MVNYVKPPELSLDEFETLIYKKDDSFYISFIYVNLEDNRLVFNVSYSMLLYNGVLNNPLNEQYLNDNLDSLLSKHSNLVDLPIINKKIYFDNRYLIEGTSYNASLSPSNSSGYRTDITTVFKSSTVQGYTSSSDSIYVYNTETQEYEFTKEVVYTDSDTSNGLMSRGNVSFYLVLDLDKSVMDLSNTLSIVYRNQSTLYQYQQIDGPSGLNELVPNDYVQTNEVPILTSIPSQNNSYKIFHEFNVSKSDYESLVSNNENLLSTNSSLNNQINDLNNTIVTLNSNINQLTSDNKILNITVTDLTNNVTLLTNQKTSLENQLSEVVAEKDNLNNQNMALNLEKLNLEAEIERLEGLLANGGGDLSDEDRLALENEIARLTSELNGLIIINNDLNNQISGLNSTIENLELAKSELELSINQKNNLISFLESEIMSKTSEINSLTIELNTKNGLLSDLETEVSNLNTLVSNNNKYINELLSNNNQLQSNISDLYSDINSLNSDVNTLTLKNNKLTQDLNTLTFNYNNVVNERDDLLVTKSNLENTILTLNNEKTELNNNYVILLDKYTVLNTNYNNVVNERDDLLGMKNDLENRLNAKNDDYDNLNDDYVNLLNTLSNKDNLISDLQSDLNNVRGDLLSISGELNDLNSLYNNKMIELEDVKNLLVSKNNELSILQTDYNSLNDDYNLSILKLNAKTEDYEELESDFNNNLSNYNSLFDSYNLLKTEKETLENEKVKLETDLSNLNTNYNNLYNDLTSQDGDNLFSVWKQYKSNKRINSRVLRLPKGSTDEDVDVKLINLEKEVDMVIKSCGIYLDKITIDSDSDLYNKLINLKLEMLDYNVELFIIDGVDGIIRKTNDKYKNYNLSLKEKFNKSILEIKKLLTLSDEDESNDYDGGMFFTSLKDKRNGRGWW